MAVASQNSVASLMRKTLDRQAALALMKFNLKKNEVEQILLNYVKTGEAAPYKELIKMIQNNTLTEDNFRNLLEDSLSCVILLGPECKQFVDVVCNLEWTSRSDVEMEMFCHFILNLVTAHTYHCPRIMASLVKLFKVDGENWGNKPPSVTISRWSNVHSVIAQIVAIMPLTSGLLMQTVIEQFPYYKAGVYINRSYVHNLLWISKYIPALQEQIVNAIINRLVVMDVNVIDNTKNKSRNDDTMFEMDIDGQDEVANSLDYCMKEMLKWLEEERDPAFNIMCNVFETTVLPTHGIRHVQFLLLYTISISQQCADRILKNLWIVAAGLHNLGPGALATRRTAASHLAGLLARCVRVPNTRLILYLRNMAEWCHSYITATQEATSSDNVKVHGSFHAICHAIFYLVAFKHHHLFNSRENLNFVESLNLPRLVTCSLNPLKTCPPQVTQAFSSVTRSHQVVYCQAIIEKNARNSLQGTNLQYDEWFPYDPYSLPVSGKMIWPLCIEYKNWGKDGDGDDETQYSTMKKKLAEDDDYLMMASPSQKLASSLSNCISPGFRISDNHV